MKKINHFRHWVQELWYQNCDEHDQVNQKRYTQQQYFQMYKYWLKREFIHQQKIHK